MTKRLYRSRTNKVLEGVCAGVGEYFDVDPVLVRLIYLMATVFTGFVPGIVGYIIAMLIVPEQPKAVTESKPKEEPVKDDSAAV
ncbi:MAG: PspC domain-containing protein [Bacillota bacterium]